MSDKLDGHIAVDLDLDGGGWSLVWAHAIEHDPESWEYVPPCIGQAMFVEPGTSYSGDGVNNWVVARTAGVTTNE